jgi:hypothetical protein
MTDAERARRYRENKKAGVNGTPTA